jgi:hypothetical protein
MRTIRTKIYTFDELSDEAKEVAIEQYRNVQEYYSDFFNDDYDTINRNRAKYRAF